MKDSPEPTLQLLFDRRLLRRNEAPDGDLDRQVDIVAPHVLAQVHLGARLAHPDHTLEVADGDGVGAGGQGFATEVGVESRDFVVVHLV